MPFFLIFLCLNIFSGGVDNGKNTKLEVSALNFSKSEKSIFGDFEPPPKIGHLEAQIRVSIYTIKPEVRQNPEICGHLKPDSKFIFFRYLCAQVSCLVV